MAYGKTIEMIQITRQAKWRKTEPAEKTDRDRTLHGKKRIKARKLANKN